MERRYGKADRIWVGDRGMMSKKNIDFLKAGNRRYIIGASKDSLKQFERELLANDWQQIRDGLEVKLCNSPDDEKEANGKYRLIEGHGKRVIQACFSNVAAANASRGTRFPSPTPDWPIVSSVDATAS